MGHYDGVRSSSNVVRWILVAGSALVILPLAAVAAMVAMPGTSFEGEVLVSEGEDRALAARLEQDVRVLAGEIGERNVFRPEALDAAVGYIEGELQEAGLNPERQSFDVGRVRCHNLEVQFEGVERPDEIIVIGAHYESVVGSPGANDNASGVAALLALARSFADRVPGRTVRFVFFANEEEPFFMTEHMGSLVYARRSAERGETIQGMVSLETMGYYDDRPGTQQYPLGVLKLRYPDEGNFIGFVANLHSRSLLRQAIAAFRAEARIPSEAAALPASVPGVGWSDQQAFWKMGYPAIMITDTAPFRYPYYHTAEDTPDKLDYRRLALVVRGLEAMVTELAGF